MTIEHVIRICFQYQNEIAIAREFYTNTVWRDKDTEKKKKGNRKKKQQKIETDFCFNWTAYHSALLLH